MLPWTVTVGKPRVSARLTFSVAGPKEAERPRLARRSGLRHSLPMSDPATRLAAALAGHYRLERELGAGGMATVYLAHDLRHERKVAVKVLKPELAAVLGAERFVIEIRTTAALQHPHILPLFDSGTADGFLFYVMPFVEGETLRDKLNRETQLGVEEAIRIATDVADALDYAHRQGVVHRDVKPENILLHDGRPMVADFGIALAVSAAAGGRMTETGMSLGTPHYMSPEQATADKDITGRSDVYSLASVLYEMLTGNPPHTGASAQQVIMRIIAEPVEPVTKHRKSVPAHVAAAVAKALEKLPADRFATAKEFAQALRNPSFAGDTTTMAGAAATTGGRAAWRAPQFLAAALVAVMALAGWGWTVWGNSHAAPPPPVVQLDLQLPDSLMATTVGSAASLALSRDGSLLVFQGQQGGEQPALWMRRLGDPELQRIRGTELARAPVLSPDGEEVLFTLVGQASTLRRVPLRGGMARTVTDSGGLGVSWGENGEILFTSGARLYVVPADGGPRRLVARPDSVRGLRALAWPHFLPGARAALATARKTEAENWLVVVDLADGRITELGIRGTNPHYSPTGHLFYVSFDGELFAVPFDARSRKATGTPQLVAEGVRVGGGGAGAFTLSHNGALAFLTGTSVRWRRDLVAVSRTGAERVLAVSQGAYSQPSLSPDGRRVAVTIDADTIGVRALPRYPDVWTIDLATSARTRVTTDSASTNPAWTADGRYLTYRVREDSVVYAVPAPGGAPRPYLRFSEPVDEVALGQPGGSSAIVPRVLLATGHRDIWLVPTDASGAPSPFMVAAYNEEAPTISPDGRWIAYVTSRTGRYEVYVRRLQGEGAEIPVSVAGGQEPRWSSDGAELFYRARGGNTFMVARLAFAPSLDVVRRDSLFSGQYRAGYSVFPGGRELLVVKDPRLEENRRGAVTLLLNWRPGRGGTSEP
jgi:hypothetical protein